MTVQELKNRYGKILGEMQYINKRIKYEQDKEYEIVSVKATGSSREFPYLSTSVTVEAEDPEKSSKSKDKIIRWQQDLTKLYKGQKELEDKIDRIEDIDTRAIIWRYCVERKTQRAIAEELCMSQSVISKKLKVFQ